MFSLIISIAIAIVAVKVAGFVLGLFIAAVKEGSK